MVDILTYYSKKSSILVDLQYAAAQLKNALLRPNDKRRSVASAGRVGRVWKLTDKLTEEAITKIVERRRAGIAVIKIAGEFNISESSVKRIVRLHRTGKQVVDHCRKAG